MMETTEETEGEIKYYKRGWDKIRAEINDSVTYYRTKELTLQEQKLKQILGSDYELGHTRYGTANFLKLIKDENWTEISKEEYEK